MMKTIANNMTIETYVNPLPDGNGVSIVDKTVIQRVLPSGRIWYQSFEHLTKYSCDNTDSKLFAHIQKVLSNPLYKSNIK